MDSSLATEAKFRLDTLSKPAGNHIQVVSFFQRGLIEYNKKNYPTAVQYFLKARKERPKDPNVLFYLGNCYFCSNQKNEGLGFYDLLIKEFPNTRSAQLAAVYIQQIAPERIQQTKPITDSAPLGTSNKDKKTQQRDFTADDLVVVLKRTGERQNCPAPLISSIKDALNRYPKGLRNCLGLSGCKIYITPSTIEKDPRLQNSKPGGYEDGTTWKNCPGYTHGREIVICAYVMAPDESGWVAADDPIGTLRHETGHELDYLGGWISEHEDYKHNFYLDTGVMDDYTKQVLAYYVQKAEGGPCESFAEITCCLLGGANSEQRKDRQKLILRSFPKSVKYVSILLQDPELTK